MKLPKIDISSLPDLDKPTGLHGSQIEGRHDDGVLFLMTYLIAHSNPGGGGG